MKRLLLTVILASVVTFSPSMAGLFDDVASLAKEAVKEAEKDGTAQKLLDSSTEFSKKAMKTAVESGAMDKMMDASASLTKAVAKETLGSDAADGIIDAATSVNKKVMKTAVESGAMDKMMDASASLTKAVAKEALGSDAADGIIDTAASVNKKVIKTAVKTGGDKVSHKPQKKNTNTIASNSVSDDKKESSAEKSWWDNIKSTCTTFFWISAIAFTLLGLLMIIAGQRYYKWSMFFIGFLPMWMVLHLLLVTTGLGSFFVGGPFAVLVAIAGGMVFGLITLAATFGFLFLCGAFTAGSIATFLMWLCFSSAMGTDFAGFLILLILAIAGAGGICAIIFRRKVLIFMMSVMGANFFIGGLALLLLACGTDVFQSLKIIWSFVISWPILVAAGCFVQAKYTKREVTFEDKSNITYTINPSDRTVTITRYAPTTEGVPSEKKVVSTTVVKQRSVSIYTLLGLFLGVFGAHNFYARRKVRALVQLVLTICTPITIGVSFGIVFCWVILDLLFIRKDGDGVPFFIR